MDGRSARKSLRLVGAVALVWILYLLRANVYFRLYPAVVVALALGLFAVSLFRTPLVERIARARGVTLDARGVAYCRKVTIAWVVFLSAHLAVTVATVFASREVWAVYNGFLSYLLIGAMFVGEYGIRRRVRRG